MGVSHRNQTEAVEALLERMPMPLERVRITIMQFLICNVCVAVVGLIGLIITLVWEPDESAMSFLHVVPAFNNNGYYLFQAAQAMTIMASLLGFVSHLAGYNEKVLCCVPDLLMVPMGLMAAGLCEGVLVSYIKTEEELKKIELAEGYHFLYHHLIKNITHEQNTFLSRFQEKYHCCGTFSAKSWLISKCNCLPMSCCRKGQENECQKLFLSGDKYMQLGFEEDSLKKYESIIWDEPCHDKFFAMLEKVKFLWMSIIVAFLVIHLMLILWYFHLTEVIWSLHETNEGYLQLKIFQARWPIKRMNIKKDVEKFARAYDALVSESQSEESVFERLMECIRREAEQENEKEDFMEIGTAISSSNVRFVNSDESQDENSIKEDSIDLKHNRIQNRRKTGFTKGPLPKSMRFDDSMDMGGDLLINQDGRIKNRRKTGFTKAPMPKSMRFNVQNSVNDDMDTGGGLLINQNERIKNRRKTGFAKGPTPKTMRFDGMQDVDMDGELLIDHQDERIKNRRKTGFAKGPTPKTMRFDDMDMNGRLLVNHQDERIKSRRKTGFSKDALQKQVTSMSFVDKQEK